MLLRNQKYGYREIPPKEELEALYPKHTQLEIAEMYGTYKSRVRRWMKYHDIKIRPPGGGNNHKYDITEEAIQLLVNQGMTNIAIAESFNCSVSCITRVLTKYGIRRYSKRRIMVEIYYS